MTRPRIGVDVDHEHDGRRWIYKTPERYHAAIVAAGGLPVLLAPADPRSPAEILSELDGLVMTGGDDVHPRAFGRDPERKPMRLVTVQRERFVLGLAREVLRLDVPCLAVCLGCQTLNLALGGDIWLDLYSEHPEPLEHRGGREHSVRPEPGGLLFRYWGGKPQAVMSHHHQANRRLADGLALEATAEDGVIEAFRAEGKRFVLGVQWHPEVQTERPAGQPLVRALVEAASSSDYNRSTQP